MQSPTVSPPVDAVTSLPVVSQRALAASDPSLKVISQTVLSEDTLWSGAIRVDGIVTVAPQATLTIMSGTVIRFGVNSGIFVLGRIVARGSTALPITFTSQYPDSAVSDWYGIVLTGTAKKNIFEHLKIQGAEAAIHARHSSIELKQLQIENSAFAIKLADSIASIKESTVTACSNGISSLKSEVDLDSVVIEKGRTAISAISSSLTAVGLKISSSAESAFVSEKSNLRIEKSVFSDNVAGAKVSNCEGSLNGSKFMDNAGAAVVLTGSMLQFSANHVSGNKVGLQLNDNLSAVWGNSLHSNSSYDLLYLGDDKMYAGGNWFGSARVEAVQKTTFSKTNGAMQLLPLLASDPLAVPLKAFKGR
jgi:hypothetical protein